MGVIINGVWQPFSTPNQSIELGYKAGYYQLNDNLNIFMGEEAGLGSSSSTAEYAIAIGKGALYSLTTMNEAIAIGRNAGYTMESGGGSYPEPIVAIGSFALQFCTVGRNVAVGNLAGQKHSTAVACVYMGHAAGANQTNGPYNTYVGYQSGWAQISDSVGYQNTGFGGKTLRDITTGYDNLACGYLALSSCQVGTQNVGLGQSASLALTSANGTVTVGFFAGSENNASNIVYVGKEAGRYSSGIACVAMGYRAMRGVSSTTNATYSSAFGHSALTAVTTADYNTAVGALAGDSITTGNSNCLFGYNTDVNAVSDSDCVVIGSNVQATATAQIRIGNTNVTTCFIEGISGVTDGSDPFVRISAAGQLRQDSSSLRHKTDVKDLNMNTSGIYSLKPRLYTRKESGKKEIGYIAEEVINHLPEVVGLIQESKAIKGGSEDVLIPNHINYEKIILPMVEEMKSLKDELKALKAEMKKMKGRK